MTGTHEGDGPPAVLDPDLPRVSVVVPVFNEEESVEPLVGLIHKTCEEANLHFEMVFVDDGSRDGTAAKLVALGRRFPRLRVLRMARNFGQTPAMQAGFDAARGEVIVTLDGDMQNDPRDIPKVLARLDEGYDIVSGWRKKRKDNVLIRTIPSRVANWIIGSLSGVRLHDSGCSLKAYRAANLRAVRLYAEMHRFIPALASISGARISEVPVNHFPRTAGRSKYGPSRIFKVAMDLAIIKMITGFAARPGRYFLWLGMPWFLAGCLFVWIGLRAAPGTGTIVLPAAGFLFIFLGFHFVVCSFLGELTLEAGSFRPDEVVEELEI